MIDKKLKILFDKKQNTKIIFLLFWAVTRNDDKDETQYVEHHHHYEENKTIDVDARDGRHTFKHTSKNDNFQGYLDLK